MATQRLTEGETSVVQAMAPPEAAQRVRERAVEQIERRRHFRMRVFSAAIASLVLVVVWAITEYNNAGGWPTEGFSQSSSIPHVWNIWIIYPLIGISIAVAIDAWNTIGRKPISESEIRREMDRLTLSGDDTADCEVSR
jgi:protein-S-isoprenylcysteine O-methyltransferase Ste14